MFKGLFRHVWINGFAISLFQMRPLIARIDYSVLIRLYFKMLAHNFVPNVNLNDIKQYNKRKAKWEMTIFYLTRFFRIINFSGI